MRERGERERGAIDMGERGIDSGRESMGRDREIMVEKECWAVKERERERRRERVEERVEEREMYRERVEERNVVGEREQWR